MQNKTLEVETVTECIHSTEMIIVEHITSINKTDYKYMIQTHRYLTQSLLKEYE